MVSVNTAPTPQTIEELVRRIVEVVHPQRIILFGSAARGDMRPDSDIDVLVVMPEGVHRRRTAQELHEQLFGFPRPVASSKVDGLRYCCAISWRYGGRE